MKNKSWLYTLMAMVFVLVLASSCEIDKNNNNNNINTGQVPVVTTGSVFNITRTTAKCYCGIGSDGGATVTAKGACWSTGITPTIADSKTNDGTGAGTFTSSITGLIGGKTYYVRAYATNSEGTGYGSALSFSTPTFSIGQSYQGGIIFYIDGTGLHGLICATTDQSTGAEWGCMDTWINTWHDIGRGQENTTAIVNGCNTAGIAARICNDLVLNGYNDWFLPTEDELFQMFKLGGFADYLYWSSSEADASDACSQGFFSGSQIARSKDNTLYVRAVRAF
jgi:hypothetical protein